MMSNHRRSEAAGRGVQRGWIALSGLLFAVMVSALAMTPPVAAEPLAGGPISTTPTLQPSIHHATYKKTAGLHLPFIANQGQTDSRAKFYAPTPGGTVFVTEQGELVYALAPKESKPLKTRVGLGVKERAGQQVVLTEEFVGGTVTGVTGIGEAPARVSYFHGNDPSRWQRDLPTYERVSLGEVYPGIEVQLKASASSVEKLFYVQPGAAPEQIKVRLRGGQGLQLIGQGELEVVTALVMVQGSRPIAYQECSGQREGVEVAYVVQGDAYVFAVGEYDRSRELVIDPILAATFLGGSGDDLAVALTLDGAGNVYVAGNTISADFPGVGPGSADSTLAGFDAFVAKLDANLSTLLAATFLGGSDHEDAVALTLDGAGNVYVAGRTDSADFPGVGPGSADSTPAGAEPFVAKLDANLSTLLAATFVGGSLWDEAFALTLDGAGNVYVAGRTASADFPGVGPGSADSTLAGFDAFVAKLDANLSTVLAATFLGGSGHEEAFAALTLDGAGNVYVAGSTPSADFPGVGPGSADSTFGEEFSNEVFVAKLDTDLSTLLAATFLGGSSVEQALTLTLDGAGNVYVAGRTASADFPGIGPESADSTRVGIEAFVAKLDANLTTLLAATFLGGSSIIDQAFALTLDGAGNVYVAGSTQSADFPGVGPASADSILESSEKAFVARLDANLSNLLAATFLGEGRATALTLDGAGNVYVAGSTPSADFPGLGRVG